MPTILPVDAHPQSVASSDHLTHESVLPIGNTLTGSAVTVYAHTYSYRVCSGCCIEGAAGAKLGSVINRVRLGRVR